MYVRRGLVAGACLALLAPVLAVLPTVLPSALPAAAQTTSTVASGAAVSGELFYTTYQPPQVKKLTFAYDASGFRIESRSLVATLPGADGIVFAPNGKLIVGGGATGLVFQVDPDSGAVQQVRSGTSSAFHVSVDPSGDHVWTAGLPGTLAEVPLNPFADGTPRAVSGDDPFITSIGFAPGRAFYTTSDPNGGGNFGRIDLTTLKTTRLHADVRGAHGITYDTYTGSMFLFGSFSILQIDPGTPEIISAQRDVPGRRFDQGTVDGRGHLFVADNGGNLVFIDYSATRKVDAPSNRIETRFLDNNLDDLAPLTGPGARPPAKEKSRTLLYVLIGAGAVVVLLAALAFRRRRV
jgi:hypothetical protein